MKRIAKERNFATKGAAEQKEKPKRKVEIQSKKNGQGKVKKSYETPQKKGRAL